MIWLWNDQDTSPTRSWKFLGTLLICLAGTALAAQTSLPQFVDVTEQSGIHFKHSLGDDSMSNLVEGVCAGCAFFDYDGDGDLDIYLLNERYIEGFSGEDGRNLAGQLTNALYRNNGDGSFSDVTAESGLGDTGYAMGCLSGDYDNDGDADVLITNWGPNVFCRNNGDGTFTDITEQAGLESDSCGIGATFLDYDDDGYLDLYVGNYIEYDPNYEGYVAPGTFPGPLAYQGQPDILYHNNGDGTFEDVTVQSRVYNPNDRAMGVTSCDIDNDRDWDIFVTNDATVNYLYRNNGDGTFTDIASETGTGFSLIGERTASMSGEFGDFNRDGYVDIVVPDMKFSSLYMNTGLGYFEETGAKMGLASACVPVTTWSGNVFDFDCDGFVDIFLTNGAPHSVTGERDLILRNDNGELFRNVSDQLGADFQQEFCGRGSAVGDYDNDGDIDILVLNINDRPALYRNDGGNQNNWLMIHAVGTQSNRDAIGTTIRITLGGIEQTRWIMSSSGYLSQSDYRAHFGLGDHSSVEKMEVTWPNGEEQIFRNVQSNQVLTLREPSSK